jgi:hypothetical protein
MEECERKRSTKVYPKVSEQSHNGINSNNNNKHSLRSNKKYYSGKTHYTDSQNSDTTAHSGKELYHLQFSVQAASQSGNFWIQRRILRYQPILGVDIHTARKV